MRHSSSIVLINRDIAAIIDGQTRFFESEAADSSAAAGRKEGSIGFENIAALHRQTHTSGGILGFDWALVKPEVHAERGEAVAQAIGNLVVEKREQPIAPINECDVNSKRLEDGGVFAANHPATDDSQAFGNAIHQKKRIGIESMDVVEGDFRRTMRLRAGGDENDFTLQMA